MNWSRILRIAFGIIAFAVIVWVAGTRAFLEALATADPGWLAASTLLYALMMVLKGERWLAILRLQELHLPRREAYRGYGLGMVLAAVTPGRVGQHVRALPLVRRGVPFDKAMAGTILDQVFDIAFNGSLVPVAVFWFGTSLTGGSIGWGLAALAAAVVALAIGVKLGRKRFAPALSEALRLGRRSLGLPLAITVVSNALFYGCCWAAAQAVGIRLDYFTVALAMIGSAVVETAPVTVAGLGTREVALLALLGPLAVRAPQILALTTIVRVLQVSAGGVGYLLGAGDVMGKPVAGDAPDAQPPRTPAASR